MERSDVLDAMGKLKLYGMRAAYDEVLSCPGSTASTGSTAKKGWRYANAGPDAKLLAHVPRSWSGRGQMPVGLLTSCMISLPAGGVWRGSWML